MSQSQNLEFNQANSGRFDSDAQSPGRDIPPSMALTATLAFFYVLSGVTQPLIMAIAKEAGIADPSCQLYMVGYYLGPACVLFNVPRGGWPARSSLLKTAGIASFDICAQVLNYSGAALAGPTLFAIIYSSVTVWTALFSRVLLGRLMNPFQWLGVAIVFSGLCITGLNSVTLGSEVVHGSFLVMMGSSMHALTYCLSEAVMTKVDEKVSVKANCAIQGIVAGAVLLYWQLIYTRPRFEELIWEPMQESQTSGTKAMSILLGFAVANFVHAFCFFHTLKYFPGGSTSAGVMKALQAVMVFVLTSIAFCGRLGGQEMCFSHLKLISLVVVVGGVTLFGRATQWQRQAEQIGKLGYASIVDDVSVC
jgi:drug/metabolite transporter (DMT)-like permease